MKKTVIVEVLLLFVFCVALACAIEILDYAVDSASMLDLANKLILVMNLLEFNS